MGPLPAAVHMAPPDGVQVHAVNVMPGGGLSFTTSPATVFGPALATPTVYDVAPPGTSGRMLVDFVTVRLTAPVDASVAEASSGFVTPCALVTEEGRRMLMRLP